MKKKINPKALILFITIPLVGGTLTALLTGGGKNFYENLLQPSLAPPAIVFPIVWSILYINMGISMYRVYQSGKRNIKKALFVWCFQLALNFSWSFIFFDLKYFLLSFIWIIILWIFVAVMTISFYEYDKTSAWLQVPYLLWVSFATYLTWAVYSLNEI